MTPRPSCTVVGHHIADCVYAVNLFWCLLRKARHCKSMSDLLDGCQVMALLRSPSCCTGVMMYS